MAQADQDEGEMADKAGPDDLGHRIMRDKALGDGIHGGETEHGEDHEDDATAGGVQAGGGQGGLGVWEARGYAGRAAGARAGAATMRALRSHRPRRRCNETQILP